MPAPWQDLKNTLRISVLSYLKCYSFDYIKSPIKKWNDSNQLQNKILPGLVTTNQFNP